VLIGGPNRVYRLGLDRLGAIADQLASLAGRTAPAFSSPPRAARRRGETLLRERLAQTPAFIWDGAGDNPLFRLPRPSPMRSSSPRIRCRW